MIFSVRPAAFVLLILLLSAPALADERMAGTKPVAAPAAEKTAPAEQKPSKAKATPAKEKAAATGDKSSAKETESAQKKSDKAAKPSATPTPPPAPRTGMVMDRKAMESLGPLTNPLNGSLGNDMWADTPRSVVQDFLPQLPVKTIWPSQLLARRILLTNGDVTMMSNDKSPASGEDLFTLRLEKLIEMGAYQDAVSLYTLIEGEPGHDRLARAGIMALMHNGADAQACLEVLSNGDAKPKLSETDLFWPQMEAICTYIQGLSIESLRNSGMTNATPGLAEHFLVKEIPGSKVLTTLVSRPNYRYSVSSPDDVADLTNLERAVLKGAGRFDYSRFKIKKLQTIPAPVLMTLATDPNMAVGTRVTLSIEAAARGLMSTQQLGTLYKDVADTAGAPALAGTYATITKDGTTTAARNAAITTLLGNYSGRELPTALLPFASMVNNVNPEGLPQTSVETGLLLLLQAGITPSEKWVTTWLKAESGDSRKSRDDILLYLANVVPENLPTNSAPFTKDQLQPLFDPEFSKESLILWAVFSGLGRTDQLHNITNADAYEKHLDLTLPTDYVMPSGSWIEKIRDAAQNGRLGETALLASVAMNNDNLEKIHPGIIREALKSLDTVGLKEEARNMALGVVLGLKQ